MTRSSFTWSNSSIGDSSIECKLDRILVNIVFLQSNAFTGKVLLQCISDHSMLLLAPQAKTDIKAPFRYFKYLAKMQGFFQVVKDAWSCEVQGTPLYKAVTKLRKVKKNLIEWKKEQQLISSRLEETRGMLAEI